MFEIFPMSFELFRAYRVKRVTHASSFTPLHIKNINKTNLNIYHRCSLVIDITV